MGDEEIPTKLNWVLLAPVLKKILNKSKSGHPLRYDSSCDQIKLKNEKSHLGIVYLEAAYIALPKYDILKLIERGKCCAFCGEVLKIYDNGRMKDDDNKQTRQKQTTIDKHERYLNGLDCSNCEARWCAKQCKDLDFRHNLLYHRPSNKNVTHPFINVSKVEIDIFYYDIWKKLDKLILEENLELCYKTIMCILQIYYDPNLKDGYESLKCFDSEKEIDYETYLLKSMKITEKSKLKEICQLLNSCFKKFQIPYLQFLKYLTIFELNNYDGSIYLIFAALKRSKQNESNIKIEYFDGNTIRDYEEFVVKKTDDNSVQLFKHHIIDNPIVKPIYTNKSSGILSKKIIQIVNSTKLTIESNLILLDQDYSNPLDLEDDEIGFISDENENYDDDKIVNIPKIILPVTNISNITQTNRKTNKIRNASFTSSGASFGEGIIKYNRDQIREMLENMSHNLIDEESSDDLDDVIEDDNLSSSLGSSINKNIVSMVKNLHITPGSVQRRKSVKFEETITTI
jgi:hypothetical protein